MGSVAVASAAAGHHVTGSDTALYPPMSDVLANAGIQWYEGYSAERLVASQPDLVIIGNAISRGNPELEYVLDHRLPMTSMAGLVGSTFIDRNTSIVITGTHGKTTTSSITTWLLEHSGRHPGFLIGGVPGNFDVGCRPVPSDLHNTASGVFVSEGDEYDTAFFDKRSKFVHYRPTIAVINNIEFDHADIFQDLSAIIRSFEQVVRIVPSSGIVLVNADDPNSLAAAARSYAPVEHVTTGEKGQWRIVELDLGETNSTWTLLHNDEAYGTFRTTMPGEHSVRNCTMAIAATARLGLTPQEQQQGLDTYRLPKRRLEEIAVWNGCTVVDDFAHHPTAIAATMRALLQRYPGRRIVACFEPRSNTTTRAFFQDELASCFDGAACVAIGPVHRPERYAEHDRLDTVRLVHELTSRGITAHAVPSPRADDPSWGSDVLRLLESWACPGDIIAILSNGNVGGLRRMLQAQG
jgi:UDP-N-acetylmuramate: L-alanyl-gamma-D-glutamyl-meso-diaminopimelate ligase